VRLLDGRFMVISQALASSKEQAAGAEYLSAFIEEMKASGFVAQALARNAIDGAVVAPPGAK
jgi:polar amino acid transport system substrate-binding protein